MKELLRGALRLLMKVRIRMSTSSRQKAAKAIARTEKDGGYALRCGCFVHVRAPDLRRLLEMSGPQAVLDVEREVRTSHEHAEGVAAASGQ
jgi:hypothetical protein